MMGATDPTSGAPGLTNTSLTLDEVGMTTYERDRAVADISHVEGVAEVTPDGENGVVVFVALENGIPFDTDDSPNPLDPDAEAADYDPDGVRERLLTEGYEARRMATRPDGVVEYAVPLHAPTGESLHVSFPMDRRTNVTVACPPHPHERAEAYLRREYNDGSVTPADVPALTDELDEEIRYLKPSRARSILCEFFGFDEETAPYGDLRDAPESEQQAYWAKLSRMHDLHSEAADLAADTDPERARDHRQKAIDLGAVLAGVPDDWHPDRDEQV